MSDQKKPIGKIHGRGTMFFRQAAGEAKNEKTGKFELSLDMGTVSPIVRSRRTGKWFTLRWPDIIELAIAAGILEEDQKGTP